MGRGKIKHRSTSIDMTAMCDVAFLLLSFFILTAKFKSADAVQITTPHSVSNKPADASSDAFIVEIDKSGIVYIELSDSGIRSKVIDAMEQIKAVQMPADQQKKFVLPGIPVDSTGGELRDWVAAGLSAYNNDTKAIHFIIKGDNAAKYPSFQGVIIAFKKNDLMKFQLLTNPVAAPIGSELDKQQKVTGNKSSEQ